MPFCTILSGIQYIFIFLWNHSINRISFSLILNSVKNKFCIKFMFFSLSLSISLYRYLTLSISLTLYISIYLSVSSFCFTKTILIFHIYFYFSPFLSLSLSLSLSFSPLKNLEILLYFSIRIMLLFCFPTKHLCILVAPYVHQFSAVVYKNIFGASWDKFYYYFI